MLFDQGKLEKMTFLELLSPSSSDEAPQVNEQVSYVVQVNPNNQTLNQLLQYNYQQGQGRSGGEPRYCRSAPRTLQFELLFDGTGVVPPPPEVGDIPLLGAIESFVSSDDKFDVKTEIEKFNQVLYDYSGESHRPRRLLMVWGTLTFPCVLTSVNYRFTLFKPDGTPLRAIATCSFSESFSEAELERRENATSPDLTHLRYLREGDTLPLMSYRIYGKSELYMEVARVNKLVNFRRLQAGSQLAFPPVDKEVKK